MSDIEKLILTRKQFSSFLNDHDSIRQFERLFQIASILTPDVLDYLSLLVKWIPPGSDQVVGQDGEPGIPGVNGTNGRDGITVNGINGQDGQDGIPGAAFVLPESIQQSYAPGSFAVLNGKYAVMSNHLILTGSQRMTASGTARLRIT